MRIFHWKFGVIMPSCSHCVHNWLFMNYLYSDGKKKNKVFFLFDLLFLGEQDFTYVRAALYVCTCRRYLLCII